VAPEGWQPDAAASEELPMAVLTAATVAQPDQVLHANWWHGNPINIIGDAAQQCCVAALDAISDEASSAALFVHAPTAIVASTDIERALLPAVSATARQALGCWLGDGTVSQARQIFRDAGVPDRARPCPTVPDYNTPEEAVRAFSFLRSYRFNQEAWRQTPPACRTKGTVDLPRMRQIFSDALASGRELVTEPEAKALLAATGLPLVVTRGIGPVASQAQAAAVELGYPVALKNLSHTISHRSDVDGARLNIGNAAELGEACAAMLVRLRELQPDAACKASPCSAWWS
jgi:acetyltransferase